MARCLLVYFSQTGSTAKVAERVADGLRESVNQLDFRNLHQSPNPPKPNGYDLLGVSSPVCDYQPSFDVTEVRLGVFITIANRTMSEKDAGRRAQWP